MTDVTKRMGELWQSMDPTQKQVYKDKAIDDKERYEREYHEETMANGGQPLSIRKSVTKASRYDNNATKLWWDKTQLEAKQEHTRKFMEYLDANMKQMRM